MTIARWASVCRRLPAYSALLTLILLGPACGGGGGGSANNSTGGSQSSIQLSVSPPTAKLEPGGTQQFSASVTGSNDTLVTWQVLEAGGGTVDQTGLYTAPSVKGTYHVQAVCDANSSVVAAAIISVPNSTGNGTIGIH